jgi:hypothetical protein
MEVTYSIANVTKIHGYVPVIWRDVHICYDLVNSVFGSRIVNVLALVKK